MQQSPFILRQKLIDAVDERYHVKDMATIVEVLGTLERLSVTKEMLETTRLGKTVNEFRKKINNEKLAKRAKALVKKWRDAVLEPGDSQQLVRPVNGNSLSSISEGPGPGVQHGSQNPLSSLGSLQQAYASGMGYNSTSSSPKFSGSSKVSPSGSHNSNSLSPRILTTVNSNSSSSNRNGNRSNLDPGHRPLLQSSATNLRHHGAMSSPLLGSASLHVSSPSSTSYLKSKSPFGPTSSVYTQSSNKSPLVTPNSPLSSSSSYAPNIEVVARTNAANKRLRKEDNSEIVSNSGPPSKKARTILNGTGVEGTLDDPLTFDELSKDSITSRTSDHSDGSSSKPVSNISSSGAPLSAAPSPLTATQDSNLSPPLSVGLGANSSVSSAALINDEILSAIPANMDDNAGNGGAQEQLDGDTVQAASKRGRRKKMKVVMNSESLLREQIAKAQAEGKIKAIEKLSRETLEDDRSRSPDFRAEESLRRAQVAALNPENVVIKNEIVEKYLKSQNELKAQMERQYQDAVARNEINFEDEDTNDKALSSGVVEETKTKSKKKKEKRKKDTADSSTSQPFPTESEILARLPPLDPQILAEFQSYVYYTDPEPEDDQKEPKSDKETENPINNLTSLSSSNQQQTLVGTKIDWGDSDEEDEDFEEVKIPDDVVTNLPEDEVDHQPMETDNVYPGDIIPVESVPKTAVAAVMENLPLREVNDSEVERLHSEKIINLNGNLDKDGQFREWQETLTVESFNGDLLHILPYTIIDF